MPDINQTATLGEVKIPELPVATAANTTDQLEANQAGVSRSISIAQVSTAVAGSSAIAGTYLPLAGGTLTGPLVGTTSSWTPPVNTAAFAASGYNLTGSNATGCFSIAAALHTTGQPDIFAITITDTSNSGGNAFAIRGGPSGTNTLIRTSMAGDTRVGGWMQSRVNDALVTHGADYFAYYLGNGSGGNIGMFAGLTNPTFSTFGRYGSIYLDGAAPGLPYYNNNGTTGWDRLVGETSTQTITGKTFGATTFTGAITGTTANFANTIQVGGGPLATAAKLQSKGADGDFLLGLRGATMGLRVTTNASGATISAVDETLVTSFQSLVLAGSGVIVNAPMTGTTAAFTGAAQAARLGVGIAPSATATAKTWTDGDIVMSGANHFVGGNLYYDSGWKYTANGTGGAVALAANSTQSFNVYTAPNNTGGAGAAATPFTALSFDAAGNPTFFGTLTGTTAQMSGTVMSGLGTVGKALLNPGDATHAGYLSILDHTNARLGYIGFIEGGMSYNADVGAHNFLQGLTGTTATFSGSVSGASFISSVDTTNYALQLGRYSAGFGRVAVNTRGAYGYEFQVGGVAALQLDATVATFASTVMAPGAQIQLVSTETGAVATGSTTVPFDDTIPQQTEGDQYMSLAITPKIATSKLVIDVVIVLSNNIAGVSNVIVSLFQDATANALASVIQTFSTQSGLQTVKFSHVMTSGTTSATTFKVRAGTNGAGTTTFNGSGGARLFGGTMASSIVIREAA